MVPSFTDLLVNVGHALRLFPPNYIRSVLGDFDSWLTRTCPPTELQLAELREWAKGLPALAHILIPALPYQAPFPGIPFSGLLFRPSVNFPYPEGAAQDPTPDQAWFFINGICTDRSVVELNAAYLHHLFKRPMTVLHNFTRGFVPDLSACAVGKEWFQVTESAAVAYPPIYAALKDPRYKRVILLAHSQGTILSAVILHLLKGLHPDMYSEWSSGRAVSPEHAVARKLAKRWNFERTMRAEPKAKRPDVGALPTFEWCGHGRRQPEVVTIDELRKLEIYCFANCSTDMVPVRNGSARGMPIPWIESYGNEKDIVARLGVLANTSGKGSVKIGGDRYRRDGAWGHLLNAHYLFPMMKARSGADPAGGLKAFPGNRLPEPRLFEYLDGRSA